MKSLIKVVLALVALPVFAQEPVPSFFSFINAIPSDQPTKLTVNGTEVGADLPLGGYTGGMGFLEKTAALKVENGDLKAREASIPLSAETSPIVVAFLKVTPPPPGSEEPPKKEIMLAAFPCSLAGERKLRAVYVGDQESVAIQTKVANRGNPNGGATKSIELELAKPVEIGTYGNPIQFLSKGKPFGMFDAESNDDFMVIVYPNTDGELQTVSVLDALIQ